MHCHVLYKYFKFFPLFLSDDDSKSTIKGTYNCSLNKVKLVRLIEVIY